MNYSGFKEYLDLLGTDVRGLANQIDSPAIQIAANTGDTTFSILKPMIEDALSSDQYMQHFYVWLHTAARELSNDAKHAIEQIDETSPHADDISAVKELATQVLVLNERVNEYADVLSKHRPWSKLTTGTMETYRVWIDEEGNSVGTPEKRAMEPRSIPTSRMKIVVIEGEPGHYQAALSCSDLRFKVDESVGGIKIAQSFVFDLSQMMADFLTRQNGVRRISDPSRQQFILKTMQHSTLLMHAVCDMAEIMHKYGYLVDTDNLYQLKTTLIKPPKGVLSEENPDAKIEIGSWS